MTSETTKWGNKRYFSSLQLFSLPNEQVGTCKKQNKTHPLRLPWLKQTYTHTLQDQHDNSASQTTCPLLVLVYKQHKPLSMGSVQRDAMYKATARTQQHKHNQNDQILSDVKIWNILKQLHWKFYLKAHQFINK